MTVFRQGRTLSTGIDAVVLHPGDEEDALIRQGETGEVHVSPVQGHDGAGFEGKFFDMRLSWVFASVMETKERHVVVMIQQYVDLYTALGPPEFRPGKKRQAEADGRGVKRQQLVLETEFLFAVSAEPVERK